MVREQLRQSIQQVGLALREPERFAIAWHRQGTPYSLGVWAALGTTAVLGTTMYGLTMGLLGGPGDMVYRAAALSLAAGLAWAIPLPALYILNSFSGSQLRASTTLLAALVTTSWGGLALIASVPICWFFTAAISDLAPAVWVPRLITLVHLLVFGGVGVAMLDVFGRVMEGLEPQRGRGPACSLILTAAIGIELFWAFGLFQFAV